MQRRAPQIDAVMAFDNASSEMDLINFLYRSYSTLKNEYVVIKEEFAEERESLLQVVAKLQHSENELIHKIRELRQCCDELLEERKSLLHTIDNLKKEKLTLKDAIAQQEKSNAETSTTASSWKQNQSILVDRNEPSTSSLPEETATLIQQLKAQMDEMKIAFDQSLSSRTDIRRLREVVDEHSEELAMWKQSQTHSPPQQLDSPITNREKD
ncbi:hypothetical protein L596_003227 [Steinernema carpocapsae]|uniref:Uncharacterized protein n=1 Tax=Steinernema carpocapsae TaxID=34508 RepID=A0A4U8URT1_STECR|nr:hypothetical protein L596_003227 [Steinernema carpocapsae]